MTIPQIISEDKEIGTGAEALPGRQVTVNYTGTFTNGKLFDTSVGKQPFTFLLGAGQVIQGWDKGVVGMKVGGKRMLTIPQEYAYGANDYGPIPGGSTLIFEIELLNVQ
ncbi:MAG: FKBP-type peptidyl-prolyl cis-trans isomerase [Candidatus Zambryskibacteria bacterium]|nr:FKBP-type peptidyl-prolyl cis-trans isomerase [Candidatus Zambryskibacteria bacterium]